MSQVGLDTTELMFSFAIALLYPFFFFKAVNKVTGYNTVTDMCSNIKYNWNDIGEKTETNKKYNACTIEKEDKLKKGRTS